MKRRRAIVLALMAFVSIAVRAQSDLPATQRLRVAVILPDLVTDDSVLQSVAKAIQDTVSLNLILAARYAVERIDFLAPAKDFAKARTYFVDKDYDGAIWGLLG